MTLLRAALLSAALLATAGCAGGFGGFGGPGGAGTATSAAPGSVTDPNSPAYFAQTIGDRVLFATDQSTLSPEAERILDAQARWLMENREFAAVIEGHADERGTREYNIALSARRAAAVRDFLVDRGVASSRLRTVPFGRERPVLTCDNESCWSQNRRAVTVLSAGGVS